MKRIGDHVVIENYTDLIGWEIIGQITPLMGGKFSVTISRKGRQMEVLSPACFIPVHIFQFSALLDDVGFIFMGQGGLPWLCCMWNGRPWLFSWHPDNHWDSFGMISQAAILKFPHNLSDDQQKHYRDLHKQWEGRNRS